MVTRLVFRLGTEQPPGQWRRPHDPAFWGPPPSVLWRCNLVCVSLETPFQASVQVGCSSGLGLVKGSIVAALGVTWAPS